MLNQPALAVGHVILPVPLIERTLFPQLFAPTPPLALFPLPVVHQPIIDVGRRLPLVGECLVVGELPQLHVEVFHQLWAHFGQLLELVFSFFVCLSDCF